MPDALLPHTHRLYWACSGCLTPYYHTQRDCIEHTVVDWCLTSIHSQTVLSTQWMPDVLLPHTHRLYWAYSGCLMPYFHTLTDCIEHTVDAWCLTTTHTQTVLSMQWMPDALLPYTHRLYWAHSGCLMPYFHIHTETVLSTQWMPDTLLPHTERLYWTHSGWLMPYFHTFTDCIEPTLDTWQLTSIHTQTVLHTQWMSDTLLPHTHTDCIEHTVDAWHLTSIHRETVLSPQWIPDSLLPYTHRLYCTHSGCLIPYFHTHTHRLYWACSGCLMPYFHTLTDCIEHTVDAWCLTTTHTQTVLSTQWMPDALLPYTQRLYWANSGSLLLIDHFT